MSRTFIVVAVALCEPERLCAISDCLWTSANLRLYWFACARPVFRAVVLVSGLVSGPLMLRAPAVAAASFVRPPPTRALRALIFRRVMWWGPTGWPFLTRR